MHNQHNTGSADTLHADAERYRYLKSRLLGADFAWQGEEITALCFELPRGASVSANLDLTIDQAMAATKVPA